MKKGIIDIKVVYKPLDTYKNVTVRSGSNRQNYNANTRYFEPDRRIDPYVVLVECGVNDVHNIVSGLVNTNLTDVSWKQSTPAGYKDILNTDTEFKIGTGSDKGKITIFKNVSDIEPVTILFSARFMDNTTKRVVNFQESFNLITLPIAESPVLLETSAPVGYNLFPTENNQGLICQADLYRGKDIVPAAYWWYKGNNLLTESNGYSGTAKNKLFVPVSALSKTGDVFKCEVADCSFDLNQLIEQKVESDAQVIEWRELYQTQGENIQNKSNVFGSVWSGYLGSDVVKTTNFSIPEFDTDEATRFETTGGTAEIKVLRSLINAVPEGDVYSYSFFIKVLGDKPVIVYSNSTVIPRVEIAPGTAELFKLENWRGNGKGNMMVQFRSKNVEDSLDFALYKFKYEKGAEATLWSPSKQDLQDLINQKTDHYKSNTELPENYRPSPKPSKLYTADFMLMKKLPGYTEEILYPTSVSPESTTVQVEMVLNTNNGIIQQPERFLSVGWLKQSNGTFKYKGFKVNISIADVKALNEAGKQLDYELREDLTLAP
ncbi:hypothetical protein ACPDHJ_05820 [Myroides sp. C8-3]|uniref:hypothetical protein n=1 Tax=Myroides sp. C8-3 TaxID=3400533 RepID=UPI003D2F5BD1